MESLKDIYMDFRMEDSSLNRLMFESGEFVRRLIEGRFVFPCGVDVYVPLRDQKLVYPGCRVQDDPDVPGYVCLVAARSP
jgi:hypothetical protein